MTAAILYLIVIGFFIFLTTIFVCAGREKQEQTMESPIIINNMMDNVQNDQKNNEQIQMYKNDLIIDNNKSKILNKSVLDAKTSDSAIQNSDSVRSYKNIKPKSTQEFFQSNNLVSVIPAPDEINII